MKFTVDGKEYEVRQLNVNDLLNEAKQIVKANWRKDALEIADADGLVGKARTEYLANMRNDVPKGQKLYIMVDEFLRDVDGITWSIKKAVTGDIDVNYMDIAAGKYNEIIDYIVPGAEVEKEVQKDDVNFTPAATATEI